MGTKGVRVLGHFRSSLPTKYKVNSQRRQDFGSSFGRRFDSAYLQFGTVSPGDLITEDWHSATCGLNESRP